jgi:DNA recombination protein RmuC
MNWLATGAFLLGLAVGLAVAFAYRRWQARTARELAQELFRENEEQRKASVDAVLENVKASFGSLSLEALSRSTEEFLKLAKARLESERELSAKELTEKKGLIDQQLVRMTAELDKVAGLMKDLEKDRVEKFGELTSQLRATAAQTEALRQTTTTLREALASTKARGQWGERMAEDVLRLAGFIENVNYLKEKVIAGSGARPDFTFLLPRDLKLNMDVKFPLDNYVRYLEAESGADKEGFRKAFLRDVKAKIKEVTSREYIDPNQNTVDYVLLFIPNEQIYAFIHEQDSSILDEGIRNRVVLCSPVTLFAVLAVIRQAVDNFALEQTSNQILVLLGTFRKQWGMFLDSMETLGKRIRDAQVEYDRLVTTRRRQLERPLERIDRIREDRQLPASPEMAGLGEGEDEGAGEPTPAETGTPQ